MLSVFSVSERNKVTGLFDNTEIAAAEAVSDAKSIVRRMREMTCKMVVPASYSKTES
jgi:hypothetical protein